MTPIEAMERVLGNCDEPPAIRELILDWMSNREAFERRILLCNPAESLAQPKAVPHPLPWRPSSQGGGCWVIVDANGCTVKKCLSASQAAVISDAANALKSTL